MEDVSGTCLLVLSGLPAAGKTSFTRRLCAHVAQVTDGAGPCMVGQGSHFCATPTEEAVSATGRDSRGRGPQHATCREVGVVVLEYDRLLPQDTEAQLLSLTHQEESAWKQYRTYIALCVDVLLSHLTHTHPVVSEDQQTNLECQSSKTNLESQSSMTNPDSQSSRTNPDSQSSRTNPDSQSSRTNPDSQSSRKNPDSKYSRTNPHSKYSRIKPDSQPLPTMEKPENVPQELWDSFVSMVTCSLDVDPRVGSVCVIIDDNMYYRSMRYLYYQLARKYRTGFCQLYFHCDPDEASSRNACRPITVADDVIATMATRIQPPDPVNNSWEKYSTDVAELDAVYGLICRATEDPVEPLPVADIEAQAEARLVCSTNIVHRVDQHLRRLVTKSMSAAKEKGSTKDELQHLSTNLQARRKQILDQLKCGHISVDANSVSVDLSSHFLDIAETLLMGHETK